MSSEAMKLAAEFNRYFTSGNGVDVPAKVSVSRDEWRALRTALQQAEAKTDEPYGWVVTGCHSLYRGEWAEDTARSEAKRCGGTARAFPVYTHPAPGVPDGYVPVPLKATPKVAMVLYEGARNCFSPKVAEGLWQDALTAAQAQKGGE